MISFLMFWFAAAAAGQELATRALPLPRAESLRHATALEQGAEGLRGGGFDYAATFTATGMRYEPALGMAAPATQHLVLRPLAVGRGARVVQDLSNAAVGPLLGGARRVSWQHGAGCSERYDVTPRGLQLSWQFDAPIAGSGDLFVRYRLDSSMPAMAAAEGLAFHLPGVGGVGIGGVTGIDALGQQVPGSLHLDGSVLELRLPAEFVDRAKFPLVLDPLIGTQFAAAAGGYDDLESSVAYDAANSLYLVAFRRVFSAVAADIRAQRITSFGTLLGGFVAVASGLVDTARPKVVNLHLRDTFVVVWPQAASAGAERDIYAASVNAATGAVSATVAIASGPADQCQPDAAGDSSLLGERALVVYQEVVAGNGNGIKCAVVGVSAPGAAPALVFTRVVTTSTAARDPAISRSPDPLRAYVCVWSEQVASIASVGAQALDRNGARMGNPLTVASGNTLLSGAPGAAAVDGDGSNFLCVYEVTEAAGSNAPRNLWGLPIAWNGVGLLPRTSTPIDTRTGTDQASPAVAFCKYKFLVAYSDQALPSSDDYDVRVVELAANCNACGQPALLQGLNSTPLRNVEYQAALASKYGGGDFASDEALIVFTEADDAPPFTGSLVAQRYKALGGIGSVAFVGSSCGITGPNIAAVGAFAAGNTDFRIQCSGVPVGAVPVLLLGFPGGEVSCGNCVYTNPVTSLFVGATVTTSTYIYPLPCNTVPLVGLQLQAQWAVFQTASNPCPSVNSLSFTRRMRLTLGW
jgi:hypothetical protein